MNTKDFRGTRCISLKCITKRFGKGQATLYSAQFLQILLNQEGDKGFFVLIDNSPV